MAVNLSIKSVPDDIAERLRARAERNHRSLQGELMAIISEASRHGPALRDGDGDGDGDDHGNAAGRPAAAGEAANRPDAVTGVAERKRLAATLGRSLDAGTRVGWRTSEDIAAELKRRFPKPTQGVPLALDIVRADRDARSR